ncbi:MAG: VCBS repeat-containing protein [Ginsengibacter sp.]
MVSSCSKYLPVFPFLLIFLFNSCHEKKTGTPLFEVLDSKKTGLDFSNNLAYNQELNLFKYIYFYNGSGIGAGDFNNDGFTDLFFASNQGQNKMYLNQGGQPSHPGIAFRDVTVAAKIPRDGGWSTGVSVVDINNDGLPDIYVCRVGDYLTLHSKNQLLINQGIGKDGVPTFVDKAAEYGLDFSGFSTQAAFFDYDNDGDLDMFLLNHSVHENGTFRPRKEFMGSYHPLSGDRIYRNNGNNTFTDVTKETGINSTAIGYGLGIAIADINLDGYPDIYIGNDFHENDYLYINQKNGTFKEMGEEQLMHTSQFSMGVDVADINNDGYPEIISMDMLPSDPYILKRSLGEDAYDIFNYKINNGYSHQYTRNNLQFNRRNGMFSEIGLYSGVAATDWSWAPLWMDFDNDGLKDLFISNGIPKRMNDIDYINFVTNGEVQKKIRENNFGEKDLSLIKKFPEIKLPNKFYRNDGNFSFTDEEAQISGNVPTFSNGSVYADLDNDGDLDIVVNNLEEPALVYENNKSSKDYKSSLRITLKGPEQNVNATGSKIIVYANHAVRTYEKFPVKGFMSSMEVPLLIGLEKSKIDSILLVWPDHSYQPVVIPADTSAMVIAYKKGLPVFDYANLTNFYKNTTRQMVDITSESELNYLHEENNFVEFDREPLIPHMVSTEGPAIAVADINHDGLEDVFLGSARNKKSALFLQQPSGKFIKDEQLVLDEDSIYENTDACWADVNNDGNLDLVAASGGNEYYGNDTHNTPRIYLNDGKGNFTRLNNAFTNLFLTASSIVPYDFNGDGYVDLFIGGRAVPWEYGQVPQSYLLLNDKTGRFKDVTAQYSDELSKVGFVTQAMWFDIDKDGDKDLLLSLEWGGIVAFINENRKFTKKVLSDKNGWWNFLLPCDVDNDGDIDIIAGNLGMNSRLKATAQEPVRLYYNDFDGNGKKEQVLTYFLNGKEIPFANKAELEKQIPLLKKEFLYAEDFAKATLTELFKKEKLNASAVLTADYFANSVLINKGNLEFETRPLPMEAQLAPFKDAVVVDANNDNLPDFLMMGNYYDNNIEMGRYDADFGTLLINRGQGNFICQSINGLAIKGQVRHIRKINIQNKEAFVLARNSDSLKVIRYSDNGK